MTGSEKGDESSGCQECDSIRGDLGLSLEEVTKSTQKPKLTATGKVLLGVFGATFVGVAAVAVPFVLPAARKFCLPYVPATTRQVKNVMALLEGRPGSVVDLGSGDGRIVIEAAKRGMPAMGIELNPWLVWYSRLQALRHGVSRTATFKTQNLWKFDLSKHENIVIFGVEQMMPQLEKKLSQELRPDGQLIACRFNLPTWKPAKTLDSGIDTVWLYKPPTS